jgi:hypothetical protein
MLGDIWGDELIVSSGGWITTNQSTLWSLKTVPCLPPIHLHISGTNTDWCPLCNNGAMGKRYFRMCCALMYITEHMKPRKWGSINLMNKDVASSHMRLGWYARHTIQKAEELRWARQLQNVTDDTQKWQKVKSRVGKRGSHICIISSEKMLYQVGYSSESYEFSDMQFLIHSFLYFLKHVYYWTPWPWVYTVNIHAHSTPGTHLFEMFREAK